MSKKSAVILVALLALSFLIVLFGTAKIRRKFPESGAFARKAPVEAKYYDKLDKNRVKCRLCFRECVVNEGERGFCRNRENREGKYYTLTYARPCAVHVDPIEKKPLFHMLAGSGVLSLAGAGCNFRCKYCNNWQISQNNIDDTTNYSLSPEDAVNLALKLHCPVVSFTYTEPTVSYEYMHDVFKLAKGKGLKTIFHTNGAMNQEALSELLDYTDAVVVDLKGFSNDFYGTICSGRLGPVLQALKAIREKKVYFEIINLIVPSLNDDMQKIEGMCRWIVNNLSPDIPLHFNRFSPAYKLTNLPPTPTETLEKAYDIAVKSGLKFVYMGNCPSHRANSTFCPSCGKMLVKRVHFKVDENNIENGRCKFCGQKIPGVWR